jgi:hypothetical protein
MHRAVILAVTLDRYLLADMASPDLFSSFSQSPELTEAAIKGLVMSIGKVVGESVLKRLDKSGEKILDEAGNIRQEITDFLFPIVREYVQNYADSMFYR